VILDFPLENLLDFIDCRVCTIHVALVVYVIVKIHYILAYIGFQCVIVVRKGRQLIFFNSGLKVDISDPLNLLTHVFSSYVHDKKNDRQVFQMIKPH